MTNVRNGTVRVLLAGESWLVHSVHVKGFDSMTTSTYAEGGGALISALEDSGAKVTYQPAHVAMPNFPSTAEALRAFDVVILSDIGANSLLLPDNVYMRSNRMNNRLSLLKTFVESGGGFMMIGGYLSFQGIEGKAAYAGTPVDDILPVELCRFDDRCDHPEGVMPVMIEPTHPILSGLIDWPALLGYNRSTLRKDAKLLATVGGDPLIAVRNFGRGRTAVFSSDCGPHWGPPQFLGWTGYQKLWFNLVTWLAGGE